MANKTISLDPKKSKRARIALYANPKAMAHDSGTKNYKISERTIRSIEEGKEVKLSTAENYSTILGYSVDELANDPALVDSRELEIDISKNQIFGPCSKKLLEDWRSHYSNEDQPPWNDLDIVRGSEREMISYVKVATLKPASLEQIVDCADDYKSQSQSFLCSQSDSHGLGGEGNQVPFIRHDLIWLLQPSIKPDKTIVEKLEQLQEGLSQANLSGPENIAHTAESMVQRLKTNFMIKNLIAAIDTENQLRFMFGELSSDCIDTFTRKTLIQGEFQHSQVKRKVLMLCLNFVKLARVKYCAWQIPKVDT